MSSAKEKRQKVDTGLRDIVRRKPGLVQGRQTFTLPDCERNRSQGRFKLKIDDIDCIYQKKEKIHILKLFFLNIVIIKELQYLDFCYHEKLSIAGNCRMCIVQINNGLGVSRAVNLIDAMIIYTE